ncbi:MAG: hypothetical protein IPG98_15935 [Burkholderiales bacterium]|nr:hypothetical protein [Burkholderiales bacterium]MBK8666918.1 hypothetical protein [Burkholderiales bacterium]
MIGFLALLLAALLSACGGGGGYAGVTGPTNQLRMSPLLSGASLPVGYFVAPDLFVFSSTQVAQVTC